MSGYVPSINHAKSLIQVFCDLSMLYFQAIFYSYPIFDYGLSFTSDHLLAFMEVVVGSFEISLDFHDMGSFNWVDKYSHLFHSDII